MVLVSRFTTALFASILGVVVADVPGLSITSPSADLWWVAKSQNIIVWTCQTSPVNNFTILIANSDPKVLVSSLAIVSIEPNYDCSKIITQDQANQPPGTGYTIQLANTLNSSDVYAQSQPFEIKALGSAYPTSSATQATGTATGSSSAASSTSTHAGAASGLSTSIGFGVAAAAAVLGLLTA